MTLFAKLTAALSAGGGRCPYMGRPKWGTRVLSISPGGGREGWAGQTWDMSVITANLRAAGAMAVVSLEMGPDRWLRSREIQCLGCRPAGPALPHGPGGRWPGLLGQLLLQLLEAFLGGPFGPEPPQAAWETLVQHTLPGTGRSQGGSCG